jgi:hypothetical protein
MQTSAPNPSENPPPEGSSAPTKPAKRDERTGIMAFIQSLQKPAEALSNTPKPSDGKKNIENSSQLYRHFREFTWAIQQNNWLKISLIVHVALALLIWVATYLAMTRPTYIQIGNATLEESAREFYAANYNKVDPTKTFDQLSYFLINNLTLLHQIDPTTKTPFALMDGMVNPKLIQKAKGRIERNRKTITSQKLFQSLFITRLLNPITNSQLGTVAVFLEGYFSIQLQNADGSAVNRIAPYRGKAIIRITPTSTVNPFPFTIENVDEVVGAEEVKKWDEENKKYFQ